MCFKRKNKNSYYPSEGYPGVPGKDVTITILDVELEVQRLIIECQRRALPVVPYVCNQAEDAKDLLPEAAKEQITAPPKTEAITPTLDEIMPLPAKRKKLSLSELMSDDNQLDINEAIAEAESKVQIKASSEIEPVANLPIPEPEPVQASTPIQIPAPSAALPYEPQGFRERLLVILKEHKERKDAIEEQKAYVRSKEYQVQISTEPLLCLLDFLKSRKNGL